MIVFVPHRTATRIGVKHTPPILDIHRFHIAVLWRCQYNTECSEYLIRCQTLHVRDSDLGLLAMANRWVFPQKEEYDPSGSLQTGFVQPGYWHCVMGPRRVSGHIDKSGVAWFAFHASGGLFVASRSHHVGIFYTKQQAENIANCNINAFD